MIIVNGKDCRFQISPAAILDFMTSLCCLYCWKVEVPLVETMGQLGDSKDVH